MSNLEITNCPNCGAPLHNSKCEYCETEITVKTSWSSTSIPVDVFRDADLSNADLTSIWDQTKISIWDQAKISVWDQVKEK